MGRSRCISFGERTVNNSPSMSASCRNKLILLIALGLLLRLMAAYLQPAFLDESYIYNVTKFSVKTIIAESCRDSHPPLYNLLMYPLVHAVNSAFILRLPCVLAGTAAICLAFLAGRRFGGEKCGLLLAAFISCSYNNWLLDAQLRSYGMLDCALLALLLMSLNIHTFGRPIPKTNSPITGWLAYTLTAVLCSSLHFTGTLAVGCYFLTLLLLPRSSAQQSRRLPCCLLLSSLLPSLCWFIYTKTQAQSFFSQVHALGTNYREYLDIPAYLLSWQVYQYYVLDMQRYLSQSPNLLSTAATWLARCINPLYAIFALLAWYLLFRGIKTALAHNRNEALIALCPPLALMLMLLTANTIHLQVLQKRHLLPLSPVLLMFISLAAAAIETKTKRKVLIFAILSSMAITAVLFPCNTKLWNQHWQGALNYLEQHSGKRDLILVYHGYAVYSFAQAYAPGQMLFNPGTGRIKIAQDYSGPLILPLTKALACQKFLEDSKEYSVFIVLNQYRYENAKDHLYDWILDNYDIDGRFHEDSYTDWAVVDVCRLIPKQPQK